MGFRIIEDVTEVLDPVLVTVLLPGRTIVAKGTYTERYLVGAYLPFQRV